MIFYCAYPICTNLTNQFGPERGKKRNSLYVDIRFNSMPCSHSAAYLCSSCEDTLISMNASGLSGTGIFIGCYPVLQANPLNLLARLNVPGYKKKKNYRKTISVCTWMGKYKDSQLWTVKFPKITSRLAVEYWNVVVWYANVSMYKVSWLFMPM